MSKKPVQKVKVHRFYKNFISIAMILVGLAIIALMILNMSGYGSVSLNSLKDKIHDLSNKVANGKDYNPEALDQSELEELDQPILSFTSSYISSEHEDSMIYFRSASYGDWNSSKDEFTKPALYTPTRGISPLVFYSNKALEHSEKYSIQIDLSSYMEKKFALDYTSFSKGAKNDCYFSATTKKEISYSMDFAPDYDYKDAKEVNFTDEDYRIAELDYRNHVYKNYLKVESQLKSKLETFLSNNNLSKDSPTIIDDVANFLRDNYVYDLNVPSSNGEDNVIFFLETSKRGICNNFAAASSMLYRTLGIPARFVTGFISKSLGPGKEQELHMQSAHAWTEVYVDGSGWFKIDTTSSRLDLDYPSNYEDSPNIPDNPSDDDIIDDDNKVLPSINFIGRFRRYYDGYAHSPSDDSESLVIINNLPEGYTYSTHFSDNVVNLIDAGFYTYLVEVKIFNENGENVTNKLISGATNNALQQGPFIYEILPRPIIFESDSADYSLNGYASVPNSTTVTSRLNTAAISEEELEKLADKSTGVVSRDTYSVDFTYHNFTAGNYSNTFTVNITNRNTGEDSSNNYSITYISGAINVV